jgi:hypothetical protein
MTTIASSPNVSSPPLEQCLDSLKQSILLVIHHEQVSGEARSRIAELVQGVLHHIEGKETSLCETWGATGGVLQDSMGGDPLPQGQLMPIPNQGGAPGFGLGELGGSCQLMSTSQAETIQVVNPETGEVTTIAQDRVIEWAKQRGVDQA